MKLCFDSIEEVKEFVGNLKGKRGPKGESDEQPAGTQTAPAPLRPPQGGNVPAFSPTTQPTFQPPQGGFPGGPVIDPAIANLVQRIGVRIDGAIASGQAADTVLKWFREQCAPVDSSATNASLDQIKHVFLAKLTLPSLEQIAKLMNA